LPEEILRTWQRAMAIMDVSATNIIAKDCLMHLMAFLGKEMESEERIHMVICFETTNDPAKNKKKTKNDREYHHSSRIVNNEGNKLTEMFVLQRTS